MAEGQGISWGKMIKGAVKITATVAVVVGVVAAAGWGASLITGAEGTITGQVASAGAAITAGVTGATEAVASALSGPINGIVDMFTGGDESTASGEKAVKEVAAETSPTALPPENEIAAKTDQPDVSAGTLPDESVKVIGKEVDGLLSVPEGAAQDAKAFITEFKDAHSAVTSTLAAAGVEGSLNITSEEVKTLEDAAKSLNGENSEAQAKEYANQIVGAFNGMDGDGAGHRIDALMSQIDEKAVGLEGDALEPYTEAKEALQAFGNAMNDLHGKVEGIAQTVNAELGGNKVELPNAHKAWAAVGAAGVVTGAAHRAGRKQGWTDRINQERAAQQGFNLGV